GQVAERCAEFHDAGMNVPLVQPVVQDDRQVARALDAAALYGGGVTEPGAAPVPAGASPTQHAVRDDAVRARAAGLWEIARPFALTASFVPVSAGATLAAVDGRGSWALYLAALIAAMLLQVGTNVINEIYDVRKGIDSITSPRASLAIVKGRVREKTAFGFAALCFALAAIVGAWLVYQRGWVIAAIGAAAARPDLLDVGALPARPGDPAELVADVTRLRDEVGFVAGHTLDEGLGATLRWWSDQPATR
ncbi:MAG: UbiA family prenyltransferase, partial [Actinobacteria bacterium]|nr:UbiA family prenyltransferase [Actinomycetota bacterium]